MTSRKFRFGVSGRGNTIAEWQAFAHKAEDLGYSTLVLPDHFTRQFAPLPALAAAAQVTTRLRFGTEVLANDFRHPVVLAKEAATLDVMTDGRFDLGIGTGSVDADNQQAGIPIDPPGVKVERMTETLAILKAFFTQDSVTFKGKHYQIENLLGYPKPVQKPHMPILLGTRGARMLKLAAREADMIGILAPPGEELAEKMAIVRQAAGGRYPAIEFNSLHLRVQIDGQPEGPAQYPNRPGLVGSRDEVIEELQRNRELYDISYVVIVGPAIDAFAPIVALLAGT
jgi:probable F420-dependent oxidoreductase